MHVLTRTALVVTGLFMLACGGSSGPAHGSLAFTTYEGGTSRIKFKTEDNCSLTWRNMVGSAVQGTYTHSGDEIVVEWDPAADNTSTLVSHFRQLGPCSIAEYKKEMKDGTVKDDDSKIYEQKKPKCEE